MDFFLASSNDHKAQEFAEIFTAGTLKIKAAPKAVEVVEDGQSFEENAFKKAKAYYDVFKSSVMADDSGLVVLAMPSILGIESARFAPEHPEYSKKCLKLLALMKDLEDEKREAYFICVLCFYLSPKEVYFFEGRVKGHIGHEIKGVNGFGYDPIFVPEGCTGKSLAELPEWKIVNSHRARACQHALKFFKNHPHF